MPASRAGITVYFWGFASIGIGVGIGARLFSPRWNRLRAKLGVASPLEYLAKRYNVPTQQALAWSGATLKIFDVAAKWFAVAVLLHGFAGVPCTWGVVVTGAVTLVCCTVGGLWADALTDFGQFVIQGVAAIVMIVAVLSRTQGAGLRVSVERAGRTGFAERTAGLGLDGVAVAAVNRAGLPAVAWLVLTHDSRLGEQRSPFETVSGKAIRGRCVPSARRCVATPPP